MQWFDDDPDAPPSEQAQLRALDEVLSVLSVQMGSYAPRSEALVALFGFDGPHLHSLSVLSYQGSDCTPVVFNRARLRADAERLHQALALDTGTSARAIKVAVNLTTNDVDMGVAYSADDAAGFTVTATNWRERAAALDPRRRYSGKSRWWKRDTATPEAFRTPEELYLASFDAFRREKGADAAECIGMASLDEGASSTVLMAFAGDERTDLPATSKDRYALHGYNLLDSIRGERPGVLLTYAPPHQAARFTALFGDASIPFLTTRARHDLLAPSVRALLTAH